MYNVKYSIAISNHAALCFTVNLKDITTKHHRWWLNPILLQDPIFCTDLENQINIFYETNQSPEISPSLLWDTLKATLRGYICVEVFKNKANKKK